MTGTAAEGVHQPTDSIFLRLCLECRGYSCPSCWNDAAGVCQTCSPLPQPELVALPQVELPIVFAEAPVFLAEIEPEPVVAFEPVVEPEPVVAFEPEVEPEPVVAFEPVAEPEPEPVVAVEPEQHEPEPLPVPTTIPAPRLPVTKAPITRLPPPVATPTPLPLAAASPTPPVARPSDPVQPAPVVMPRPRPQISFDAPSAAGMQMVAPPMPLPPPAARIAAQPYYLPLPSLPVEQGPAGVRPCRNCHLAVSAKAHFCRRCGSAQLAS